MAECLSFPEFLALMPFQDLCRCGVGNNTFICKSFNLQVSSFLVTFERTATFSQLSHDGRTAVERDKNARKIVANSP